jgi:hypothetical protein
MRYAVLIIIAILISGGCEVQSGISRKSVEKYQPTPTPSPVATIEEEPIDPADIVKIDTSVEGKEISLDKPSAKVTAECKSYDRVAINTDGQKIEIKGACERVMINGKGNDVTAEAVSIITVNGDENNIRYSKFINGRRPTVTDNGEANTIEKAGAPGT